MARITKQSLRARARTIDCVLVGGEGPKGYYIKVDGAQWAHALTGREADAFLDGFEARDSLLPENQG